jgi:hypothetical protein
MDYTNENLDDATKSKLFDIENMFINMRASGQTVREIARKLKKSDHTISDLNKKYFRQVKELQKEKLEVLQKKMFEQKQERLDFLTEQLRVVKEAISEKKISLSYNELVTLAIKISTALNKCERDMLITDLLGSKENISNDVSNPPNPVKDPPHPVEDPPHRVEDPPHRVEDPPWRTTNGAENNSRNLSENNGVTSEIKNSGNTATKNKKSKSQKSQKPAVKCAKQNSEAKNEENKHKKNKKKKIKQEKNKQVINKQEENKQVINKQEENKQNKENINADLPPRTRADFYRRVLKNNTKAPT